jgi:Fur family ferric uptake transcriptional regulator
MKRSRQRDFILENLRKTKTHPSAGEVYGMVRSGMPRISLGTVYRNLELLAEAKVIRRLGCAGSERRYDGDMSPHLHIRCLNCDLIADIMDVPGPELVDLNHVGLPPDFTVTGFSLELTGLCPACNKEKASHPETAVITKELERVLRQRDGTAKSRHCQA